MKSFFHKAAAILFMLAPCISGCRANECADYRALIRDNEKKKDLLDWADSEIFSRTFSSQDFRVGGMIGPGRDGANLSPDRSGVHLPEWLSGYVIRAVGPNKFQPSVIFVGKRRYQGVIITRGPLAESLNDSPIQQSRLEEQSDRLAIMCYID